MVFCHSRLNRLRHCPYMEMQLIFCTWDLSTWPNLLINSNNVSVDIFGFSTYKVRHSANTIDFFFLFNICTLFFLDSLPVSISYCCTVNPQINHIFLTSLWVSWMFLLFELFLPGPTCASEISCRSAKQLYWCWLGSLHI